LGDWEGPIEIASGFSSSKSGIGTIFDFWSNK